MFIYIHIIYNRIGGVMVSMLASSVVDSGFESQLGQSKDYKICICCFSAKHTALRNQDYVSEWGNMLFQFASIIKIQLSVLV
jgi:hypothetical protein